MKLHDLHNTVPRQARKRVGRGDGSGHGRTAGRGDKGAGARTGHTNRPYFEGGQIPLIRRLPKRGFKNPNHIEYEVINLAELEELFEAGATVDAKVLQERGVMKKGDRPLKVITKSRVNVSNFKLRKGMAVGASVTLRRGVMYNFLYRLINIVLPRVRDFRGISPKSFDGVGNYNFGLTDQSVFTEIDLDKINVAN